MTKVNANTQKGRGIIWSWKNARYNDIFDAYDRPSDAKISSFLNIRARALNAEGYNGDLRISGKSCNFYSTVYSTTVNDVTTVIMDTYANTYYVEVAEA